jgi:hypothetical protein
VVVLALTAALLAASVASARVPPLYKNCTNLTGGIRTESARLVRETTHP